MKDQYLVSIRLIERLHRRFLDVIKGELDRLGIEDINNVQTLILFNINEDQLTVGELTVRPGAANVIPGTARLSVDVRHGDDEARAEAVAWLRAEADRIAARRGVELVTEPRFEHGAVPCAPELVEALERAVSASGIEPLRLVSGAGHDAVQLASLAPVGMLFVRCAGGVSHDPAESVAQEDVAVALEVLGELLESLADRDREVVRP